MDKENENIFYENEKHRLIRRFLVNEFLGKLINSPMVFGLVGELFA